MNTVKTPKGTVLPLISLKGKDYLQVAHRLIWFTEEVSSYEINSELLLLTDEQTVARTTVTVMDPQTGRVLKRASATKRETKKDFSDHTEKAETGSLGRALAELGYGTQFAIADLEEGDRLADSPMPNTKKSTVSAPVVKPTVLSAPSSDTLSVPTTTDVVNVAPAVSNGNGHRPSSFKKATVVETNVDGWE